MMLISQEILSSIENYIEQINTKKCNIAHWLSRGRGNPMRNGRKKGNQRGKVGNFKEKEDRCKRKKKEKEENLEKNEKEMKKKKKAENP